MNDPATTFVIVSDQQYFPRAKKTIQDLRAAGCWQGSIVYISVGFNLPANFRDFYRITEKKFPEIDKSHLLSVIGAGYSNSDGRETKKLTQWEKLHVFDDYFRSWKRVAFLDAGLRVLGSVKALLDLDYHGAILCPDTNYTEEKRRGNVFSSQIVPDHPELRNALLEEYGHDILGKDNFLNCIWVYDTSILEKVSKSEMIHVMNKYPIFRTNEMGVMNLLLVMKYNLWRTFPYRVGDKYLFDWCEYEKPGTTWRNFYFLKYPVTISFEDT